MNQREQYKRLLKYASSLAMVAVQVLMYGYTWLHYYNESFFFRRGNWLMTVLYGALLLLFVTIYGGLKIGYLRTGDLIYSQILALVCVNVVTYVQICLLRLGFITPVPLLLMMVCQCICSGLWTVLFQKIYRKIFPPRRLIMVCGTRSSFGLMSKMNSRSDKYRIEEAINIQLGLPEVYRRIEGYEGVIIGDIPSQQRNDIMKYCFSQSIRTYMLPKISDIILRGSVDIHLFDTPLLLARNYEYTFEQKVIKRLTDIIGSLILIVVSSPIMLASALAIKLQDGGYIIHRQTRLTMDGREFNVYKFRSMIMDAEKDGVARLASEGDVRVTPVGKILRRTRADELPQLFNVLKGEMSLVGPRPERPQIAEEYMKAMPEFAYRLKVKGGLTGYAQIYGKYNTTPYDKLKMDLMYIENYSFLLDLKLILMTVKVVFMKESTEGVAEENQPMGLGNGKESGSKK